MSGEDVWAVDSLDEGALAFIVAMKFAE